MNAKEWLSDNTDDIYIAAISGDYQKIKSLIKAGANFDIYNSLKTHGTATYILILIYLIQICLIYLMKN